MKKIISGVYEIRNTQNGYKYIGSGVSIQKRWSQHINNLNKNKHINKYLQCAWLKYGADCFEFNIIEQCFIPALIPREQFYMNSLCPEYNILPNAGSRLGFKHTPETRAKMSIKKMGNQNLLGHKHSLEARAKMSIANKGNKRFLDHKHSFKTRAKMSAARKGKSKSIEHRAKMSISARGNTNGHGNLGRKYTKKHLELKDNKLGDTFVRPEWHRWVYGGDKNPQV